MSTLEESSGQTSEGRKTEQKTIDIASLCLDIAMTPIGLDMEREYARKVGVLEVLVREDKLPPIYIKFACSYCLGLLHLKFQPFWEPASLVLIAAAARDSGTGSSSSSSVAAANKSKKSHRDEDTSAVAAVNGKDNDLLWPLLFSCLSQTLSREGEGEGETVASTGANEPFRDIMSCDEGLVAMRSSASLSDMFYFQFSQSSARDKDMDMDMDHRDYSAINYDWMVSDVRADLDTVCGSYLTLLKRCPSITIRHSKAIVPMYFRCVSIVLYCIVFYALSLVIVHIDIHTHIYTYTCIPF
jgi:hypothetical protein